MEFVDTRQLIPSPALRGRPSREREGGKIGRLFLDRYCALLLLFAFLAVLACSPVAADDEKERLIAFLKEIDAIVDKDGISAAVKKIESQGDTTQVIRNYFIVTNHFYRSKKDITKMLAFGEAAMAYLLEQAEMASKNDAAQADKLKGFAKSMAYNISVNAWPGWNEQGIKITREHSKAGMHALRTLWATRTGWSALSILQRTSLTRPLSSSKKRSIYFRPQRSRTISTWPKDTSVSRN